MTWFDAPTVPNLMLLPSTVPCRVSGESPKPEILIVPFRLEPDCVQVSANVPL